MLTAKRIIPLLLAVLIPTLALGSSFFRKTGLVNQTTVTATAGGTTTLVATSNQVHILTGASTQNLRLPDATGLYNGWFYYVSNESTGTVTVQDSSGATIATLKAGTWAEIKLSSNVGATGNWRVRVGTQEASIDHGLLQGLSDDDHPQYLNTTRGDARYFEISDYILAYTGFAGEPVKTNSLGFVDGTLLNMSTKGDMIAYDGTKTCRLPVGLNNTILVADSSETCGVKWSSAAGSGDVLGPASSTDEAIARFDGTTGKVIQNSGVLISDTNSVSGVVDLTMTGDLTVDTSTLKTFATSNRVGIGTATPDGTLDAVGGEFFLPAPAATPNTTSLANSQFTVSIDETNNTFEFLAKESGGTTFQRSLGVSTPPGGADTNVQYNDAGAFGGESTFTYNETTNGVTVSSGFLSVTGAGSNSQQFGPNNTASGTDNVSVGDNCDTFSSPDNICVGNTSNAGVNGQAGTGDNVLVGNDSVCANASGTGAVCMGNDLVVSGDRVVKIGHAGGTVSGSRSIGIGIDTNLGANNACIAIGDTATCSAANQLIFGSSAAPVTNGFLGEGVTTTSPSAFTLQVSSASGTDVSATDFNIAGGKGTGNATAPFLNFQVATPNSASGTTLQSLVERFRVGRTVEFPQEIITPASPAAGYTRLYSKNDGNLYQLTPAGVETSLVAAAGAAGSDTQIQFNNGGAFGADADFVWLATSNRVGIAVTPDTSVDINGTFAYRSTNVALGGNVTDIGTATTSLVRLTAIATTNVLGLANGTNGKLVTIMNDTGLSGTIANESGSASAANRILTGTGGTITIATNNTVLLQYDSTDSRWRLISANSPSGVVAAEPTFDSSTTVTSTGIGEFTVPSGVTNLGLILVGGGGGGGGCNGGEDSAGGGGAGGSVTRVTRYPVTSGQVIKYFVGSGGAGGVAGGGAAGSNGGNTAFGDVLAKGGGGGGSSNSGGSVAAPATFGNVGGNGTALSATAFSYATATALGTSTGFFSGGGSGGSTANSNGRGGGGAGAAENGSTGTAGAAAGDGGDGFPTADLITGALTTYGGGGGGGTADGTSAFQGAGGAGGGGAGARATISNAVAGTANTGGAGGGCAGTNNVGGAGGSGKLIVYWDAP